MKAPALWSAKAAFGKGVHLVARTHGEGGGMRGGVIWVEDDGARKMARYMLGHAQATLY